MTKSISATITWKRAEDGGRARPLDSGIRYFPTITRDADETKTPWSAVLLTAPADERGRSQITFQLLVDNDLTAKEQEFYTPGIHFCLWEGQRLVATGVVV